MRFEALIEAYHDEIYRYTWRLLAGAGRVDGALEAADLTQEVFMRAYGAYGRLREGSNVRAWLYKIATNCAYTALGKQVHEPLDEDGWSSPATLPEEQAARGEALDDLRSRIALLPPKQQAALVMRYLHDLDYGVIGRALDCSPDSARANVYQALRRLRVELAGEAT